MDKTAVIIRTHFYNECLGSFADRIRSETGFLVCFVVDERRQTINVPERFLKISHTLEAMTALELFTDCSDLFWRCGDYVFYNAYQKLQDYAFFWVIEPDIYLNFSNLNDFFNFFEKDIETDFLSLVFDEANPSWGSNFENMNRFSETVYRCYYSLMRLSNRSIKFLLHKRQSLTKKHFTREANKEPLSESFYPNDESFTATTLVQNGFRVRDMNDYGKNFYTARSMYEGPFSPRQLTQLGEDQLIYNHVFSGAEYTKRAFSALEWENVAIKSNDNFKARFSRPEICANIMSEDSVKAAAAYLCRVAEIIEAREASNK